MLPQPPTPIRRLARYRFETGLPAVLPMARDREAYSRFEPGDPPLLHCYTWQAPALTIGRFQSLDPAFEARLAGLELPVIRRATGGAAILHSGDLTFSLIGPPELLPGSLLQGHARVTRALASGLASLGIASQSGKHQAAMASSPNCFALSSPADLCLEPSAPDLAPAKLVGTAQVRRRKAFLLQGVIYLKPDPALLRAVFGNQTSLADLASQFASPPDPERVATALREGFAGELGLEFG